MRSLKVCPAAPLETLLSSKHKALRSSKTKLSIPLVGVVIVKWFPSSPSYRMEMNKARVEKYTHKHK